jgi:Co/Zn/Cd efflux system component
MDCSAEEQMVRMKLENIESVRKLDFNLTERTLVVFHSGAPDRITDAIRDLDLDSKLIRSDLTDSDEIGVEEGSQQAKLLWAVLIINFGFFVIEMITGLISGSMGLVADSLDMFADAAVYGLSLLAIGKALSTKKLVAKLAGYFQFTLAVLGFSEVVRRFIGSEGVPDFRTMIIVSVFALTANIVSLYLLQKTRSDEAHLQASMIFTSNDIIVNGGVIIAGILVHVLASNIPDLVIGAVVFAFVIRGSFRILKLAR